jgi:hypothetical protein
MDNHPLFPDVCAKTGKWFRRHENYFVAAGRMKQSLRNLRDFNGYRHPVVQWASGSFTGLSRPSHQAPGSESAFRSK